MSDISTLGYVVLNVSDLDQWESFATDILGLQVGQRTDNSISLRMDEREQNILLERGTADDLAALGWEFDTFEALREYVDELRAKDVNVIECDGQVTQSRKAERVFYCIDPEGLRHEFFTGPKIAPLSKPFRSKVLVSGFETGRLGVGHTFCIAQDYPGAVKFATEKLGLRLSDYIRDSETFPGVTVDATFLHSATGRHHSIGLAYMPFPKKMHHLMVQVKSLDDVGLAFDRVRKAGVPVVMEIGHHPNDGMVSFYCAAPSGFAIEFGWGGLVIDDSTWNVRTYSQLDDWGHQQPGK
ncbi:VOC family protein [Paraburkholderia lycopersici]|uniref:2,3-dihydroxybiphenyl 1,2-dioxygenase n=1 Tax=Paraburkholderia lycopersici TaxID=416944 RepID=A0A1G7CI25_9BURK|nr:VOC family protein [Paraburkholderia lycopersici]SDE38949.1 2,3-dihydroxybiphenyl 1,2-dioxygenase [Paraburkholderia lycopersici]